MQDVGQQGGYGAKLEDLSPISPEWTVESLGHCQSVGNWMLFPEDAGASFVRNREASISVASDGRLSKAVE
jgi:hypothetical protein